MVRIATIVGALMLTAFGARAQADPLPLQSIRFEVVGVSICFSCLIYSLDMHANGKAVLIPLAKKIPVADMRRTLPRGAFAKISEKFAAWRPAPGRTSIGFAPVTDCIDYRITWNGDAPGTAVLDFRDCGEEKFASLRKAIEELPEDAGIANLVKTKAKRALSD